MSVDHKDLVVNKELINAFIRNQKRDGIRVLAELSDITTGSLSKIRSGRVPRSQAQRQKLAEVLGVSESDLFSVSAEKDQAS